MVYIVFCSMMTFMSNRRPVSSWVNNMSELSRVIVEPPPTQ